MFDDKKYPEFFRCFSCHRLGTKEAFVRSKRCFCTSRRLVPTKVTLWEEIFYLLKNPQQLRHAFGKPKP